MKGIDCTQVIDNSIAKQLKDLGYSFACRYLVPETEGLRWKRLVKSEIDALTAQNMNVVCVFEKTADRVKGGASAGTMDGRDAEEEAAKINQPAGSAVYFAVDYNAGPEDYDTIESYLKAAQAELADYNVGVYAGYYVIEAMAKRKACKHFWQTYAWSQGKISPYANVYQNKNGVMVSGILCDLDDSYGNEGWWNYNMSENLTWKQIIEKVASNPEGWEKAINTAVNMAKADGSLGDLEIMQFLPVLIEKIWNAK